MRFSSLLCVSLLLTLLSGCVTNGAVDPYDRFRGGDLALSGGGRELFWFSGIHTNDPSHPMFDDLKRAFEEFDPDFVLVEGGFERRDYRDARSAMLQGESAYTVYLARRAGISAGSMEPDLREQIERLSRRFEARDILAMYLLRQTVQLQRESALVRIDYPRHMTSYARRLRSAGLELTERELEAHELARLLSERTGVEDPFSGWRRLPASRVVYDGDGSLHSVYRSVLEMRDEYGVDRIAEALRNHSRVFVMMGADHIAAQEEDLRALF